jgi:hypothetical protein
VPSDSGASSMSDSLSYIYICYINKAALADPEKKINNARAKWAGIDEGKAEMKKVHDAEKELDKAKDAWMPLRKVRRKESRFESVNHRIFLIDLLENDQFKRVVPPGRHRTQKKVHFFYFFLLTGWKTIN